MPRQILRPLVILCVLGGIAACGDDAPATPPDGSVDAGIDSGADPDGGAGSDAGSQADGGVHADVDSGVPADAGPTVADLGPPPPVGTCEPCATSANCDPGSYCALLGGTRRGCLPSCNPDLPSCPAGLNCTLSSALEVDEYICAPLGGLCCVDEDRDGYGRGECMGNDCDDGSASVHPGATELCNAIDDDCDGVLDDPGC